MKTIDRLMLAFKVLFSLINGTLAIIFFISLYNNLIELISGEIGVTNFALSLYLFLIFVFNTASNWKYFSILISVFQVIGNFLLLPLLIILMSIAPPLALAVVAVLEKSAPTLGENSSFQIDPSFAENLIAFLSFLPLLLFGIIINIILQAFYNYRINKNNN